jgi:hypothetical protein
LALHRSYTRGRPGVGGSTSAAATLPSRLFSIRTRSSRSAASTSLESPQPSASSSSRKGREGSPVELAHVEFSASVDGAGASAAPVLLLHGLLGNKRNFATIATSLSRQLDRKRRLVGLDLRNHGTWWEQHWRTNAHTLEWGFFSLGPNLASFNESTIVQSDSVLS